MPAATSAAVFEITEDTHDITFAYNAIWSGAASANSATGWVLAAFGSAFANIQNVAVMNNWFDGTTVSTSERLAVAETDSSTVHACDNASGCPLIKNGVWFAERGGGAACIKWSRGTGGSPPVSTYTCTQMGTTLNSDHPTFNTGNFRADTALVGNRTNTAMSQLSNLRFTSAATNYIDTGQSVCHANGAGTNATTINVVCDGHSTNPQRYFPDPANVYGITNASCRSRGTRTADGAESGCFDIEIAGCGVRQVTSMTSTSINFTGGSCSWADAAQVGVPWIGTAQDIGPLEYLSAPILRAADYSP